MATSNGILRLWLEIQLNPWRTIFSESPNINGKKRVIAVKKDINTLVTAMECAICLDFGLRIRPLTIAPNSGEIIMTQTIA